MAFTIEDFEDLQRLLAAHPEWRAQLRPLILGDEFMELPARIAQVEKELAEIRAILREMADHQARTEVGIGSIEGTLGRHDGKFLELTYDRQLRSWFGRYVKGAQKLAVEDLGKLDEAVSTGAVDITEVERLQDLDFLVRGRRPESGEDVLFAVEVSTTVRVDDVDRTQRRALTLQRAGYAASGFVGGVAIEERARTRADELGVIVDLHPSFSA
ncbi:MAG: hypothetical protein ACRDHF_01985 [Tepidiformaceae bacterium]